jgi:calcineurin-like phosphoesterase family protein
MDAMLIERWNEVVAPDDEVYHLGDFTLGGQVPFMSFVSRLNGQINFVPGGHDYRWTPYANRGEAKSKSGRSVFVLPALYTLEVSVIDDWPTVLVLCHYSLRVWDRSHYGSYHLYGHSHGKLAGIGRSMDVGVDTNNFYPWSIDQIKNKLAS